MVKRINNLRIYKALSQECSHAMAQNKNKLATERETCILSEEIKFICSFPTNTPEPLTLISVFLALQKQQSTQNIMFFQILDLECLHNKLIKGHRGANV